MSTGHENGELVVPSRCRINMLHGENFKAAFLAEFGLSPRAIAHELGLTEGQVYYRLKRARVRVRDYRSGQSVIAQMIIKGTRRAGVGQLRDFTEQHLRTQLRQIGWKEGNLKPAAPPFHK